VRKPCNRPEILCACCRKFGTHKARNLCTTCYDRHENAGTLHHHPLLHAWATTRGRVDDYTHLRHTHDLSIGDAAARLGIHKRTAERYEARLRARAVPA
jgi:hypothetical protein